jgi:hypothetical protein
MPEVLRIAAELYAREQSEIAQTEERHSLVEAAVEVGLPPEYLERAAAIVMQQEAVRSVARHGQRSRKRGLAALSAGFVAAGVLALMLALPASRQQTAPAPPPAVAAPLMPVASAPSLIGPCTEVDLSPHMTQRVSEPMLRSGNDLGMLLAGLQGNGVSHRILDGVPFRIQGLVLVGPGETSTGQGTAIPIPPQVEGITIDQKAKRLHFLHGTHWRASDGTEIGAYVVHYEDGSRLEIPIRYGEDVRDWWVTADRRSEVTRGRVVWNGSNEASRGMRSGIRLYMRSWENPYPEKVIRSIDMVTGEQAAGPEAPAPFLVGLTIEQEGRPAARATPPSKVASE